MNTMSFVLTAAATTLALLAAGPSRADAVRIDTGAYLLDGTEFTAGQTYYAGFQLNGGTVSQSQALVGHFELGGGSGVAPSASDYKEGQYSAPASGIFDDALMLSVAPTSAFSFYSQQFVAGDSFSFDYTFSGDFSGLQPDAFAFQLYSAGFDALLYEVRIDVHETAAVFDVPEPSSLVLSALALAIGLYPRTRHSRLRKLCD